MLDISSNVTPGLTMALLKTKTLCLQQLVDAVGPALEDTRALSSLLGLHSVRVTERLLELWRQRLPGKEKSLLMDYGQGKVKPDPADPFPEIFLSPALGELTGPLLTTAQSEKLTLHKADKKTWYMSCVKAIHKAGLSNRPPTVWSERLGTDGVSPQWRILYKPPLKKRTADLQWRILHGSWHHISCIKQLKTSVPPIVVVDAMVQGAESQLILGQVLQSSSTQYRIIEFIGEGSFGKVAKCQVNSTSELVAVKILKDTFVKDVEEELSMLSKISVLDPDQFNLVKFHERFEYSSYTCLVFELLGMDLLQFLKAEVGSSMYVNQIRPIAKQMLVALQGLQSLGIMHTDIKPDNVML
ncbi:homeodomain-interacting protein kinase 1-like, partial [Gouania willdenowi]|uniref:homeodomain-interacting protein kinase 1-like n=1 Tax=Gouania willdenowi TaxID=441366 RepID=UPI001055816E